MNSPSQTLRPLGLGEVLDRAVTLCVRHFVPLALIFVIYAIPYAIVEYLATQDLTHVISSVTTVLQSQTGGGRAADPSAIVKALGTAPHLNGWYPLLVVLTFFVGPLPAGALIHACDAYYFKRETTLRRAYRVALGRWLPLVGVNCLFLGAGLMLYVGFGLVAIVVTLGLVVLTSSLHAVGVAIAVAIGAALALVAIAFLIVATLAVQIAYFTCVIERENSIVAFARGIGRVFIGIGLARSLLVGIAYVTIAIGIGIVALVGESIVVGLVHNAAAGSAYAALVRVATAAFTTAFVAIFYYDLRVREEGLDLALAADAARDASLTMA